MRAGAGTVADPYVHALTASGTVQLVGVAGISLAGTLSVRLNQLGQLFSVSVPVAGGDPVVIAFVTGEAGSTATPFTAITGNLTLTALGQTLTGAFTFTKTAAGLDVSATGVVFRVVPAGASAPVASLTGGTASLRVGSSGLAGRVSGTVTLDAPGVGATLTTGTFALEVNTTGAIVPQFGSLTGDLPAGPVPAPDRHRRDPDRLRPVAERHLRARAQRHRWVGHDPPDRHQRDAEHRPRHLRARRASRATSP